MSSTTTTTASTPSPTPLPAPAPAGTATAVEAAVTDVRKSAEIEAKTHINTIWQKLENAADWPLEKLAALVADLKKHV